MFGEKAFFYPTEDHKDLNYDLWDDVKGVSTKGQKVEVSAMPSGIVI